MQTVPAHTNGRNHRSATPAAKPRPKPVPAAPAAAADPIAAAPPAARRLLAACPAALEPLYRDAAPADREAFHAHAAAWHAFRDDRALHRATDVVTDVGHLSYDIELAADRLTERLDAYRPDGNRPSALTAARNACDTLQTMAAVIRELALRCNGLCDLMDENAVSEAVLLLVAAVPCKMVAVPEGGAA